MPGRIELLPAVPDYLRSGRLRGVRTLSEVIVADLRCDAGDAEAVLVADRGQHVDVGFRQAPTRRVTLSAGVPTRLPVRVCGWVEGDD